MLGSCFQMSLFNHFFVEVSGVVFSQIYFWMKAIYFFRSIFDEINDGKELKSCNSVKTFTYGRGCDCNLMELRFFFSVQCRSRYFHVKHKK